LKYNIFLIGPAGSGKSTLGEYIAFKKKINFLECDKFHNQRNILKMKKGISISNKERLRWVMKIKKNLIKKNRINLIIAFSGLILSHRKILIDKNKKNFFFFLKTTNKILKERLSKRRVHFFNPLLLRDQIKLFQKSADLNILNSNKSLFYNYTKVNNLIKF
jgi:gluconokinase